MMKKLFITVFFLLTIASSCNKDEFPDEFSITGGWIENITAAAKTEIFFNTHNQVYLRLRDSAQFDTLRYKLEKKDELQLFLPAEYPDGQRSYHKLGYSQKKDELSVYGLYPSVTESSKTVFRRK